MKVNKFYLSLLTINVLAVIILILSGYNYAIMRGVHILMLLIFAMIFLRRKESFNLNLIYFLFYSFLLFTLLGSKTSIQKIVFAGSFFSLIPLSEFFFNKISPVVIIEKFFKSFFILILTVTLAFLLFNDFQGRFSGFSSSATTFSVYLTLFFNGYLFSNKRKNWGFIMGMITFALLLLSGTRSTLLIFVFSILIYYKKGFFIKHKKKVLLTVTSGFIFIMPLINVLSINIDLFKRYEGEKDESTYTRLSYFNNQVQEIIHSDFSQLLFGNGLNENKKVGAKLSYDSVDQHNDFFILIYDYGLLFFFLFFLIIYSFINSPLTLSVYVIYMSSFYHNMIYDIYILTFLILASCLSKSKLYENEKIYDLKH